MSNIIDYNFRKPKFLDYGLDKERNFIEAPICGKHGKAKLNVNNIDEAIMFAVHSLSNIDCDNCVVFIHAFDGTMMSVIRSYDEENDSPSIDSLSLKTKNDMSAFKRLDEVVEFHHYALLVECNDGWTVIEE